MSNKEFEERLEQAPDWATAVANLRDIVSKDGDPAEPRLALLKDTAPDTMLACLAHRDFEISSTQMWRSAGTEIRFGATPFLAFVFQKAFLCYRKEMVPPEDLVEAIAASGDLERARTRVSIAFAKLPPELHRKL